MQVLDNVKNPTDEESVRNRLRLECEKAKIALSEHDRTTIRCEHLIVNHEIYEDYSFEMEVTRQMFEEWAQPVFNKLQAPLQKALGEYIKAKKGADVA